MNFKSLVAAMAAFMCISPAQAALIDFTDGIWEAAITTGPDEFTATREFADGVRFRFLLSRGLSSAELSSADGLFFGPGAQLFLSVSSTEAVRINGLRGRSTSQVPQLPFRVDYSIGATPPAALTFTTAEFLLPIGPIDVPAESMPIESDEFFFIDHTPYDGPFTSGFLTGIEFEKIDVPTAVPSPASLPLLAAGMFLLGWNGRKPRLGQ